MSEHVLRRHLVRLAGLLAGGLLLLGAACTSEAPAPAATPSAGAGTAVGTAAAGATGSGGAPTAPAAGATAEPVASTAATPTAQLPHAVFVSGQTRIELPIEVPSEREYAIGLSGRRSLEGRGMLFAFPDGANTGFWMKNTHIDLDIAFVDASMRVIHITTMRADTLDHHRPSGAYVAAIEAPAGWYAASGIAVGAQVTLPVDLRAAAAGR
ncbi:MAG: DUF192 domain-containing protein [Dehalococcoidia bacterium]